MKKKEVQDLLKKGYIIGGGAFAVGLVLTLIMIPAVYAMLFTMVGMFVFAAMFFIFIVKAKKMEANACIKCATNEKTVVTKDELLSDEKIKDVTYEVHLVTHTCKNCGTSYTCHEYMRKDERGRLQ